CGRAGADAPDAQPALRSAGHRSAYVHGDCRFARSDRAGGELHSGAKGIADRPDDFAALRIVTHEDAGALESRISGGKLFDAGVHVIRVEDRRRTRAAGANESGGAAELRVLHVRIRKLAFARIPPFDSLVATRIAQRSLEKSLSCRV